MVQVLNRAGTRGNASNADRICGANARDERIEFLMIL